MPTLDYTLDQLEQKLTAAIAEESQDIAVVDEILRQCEAFFATERLLTFSEPEIARLTEFNKTLTGLIEALKTEQAGLKKDLATIVSGKKMRKHFS